MPLGFSVADPFQSSVHFPAQPTMLRVLPVQVRPRELAVNPRSHIRHLKEATLEVKARM